MIAAPTQSAEVRGQETPTRAISGAAHGKHERLLTENVALVHFVLCRQFPFLSRDAYEDAAAVGLAGLWQAALRFDGSRGTFSSYACPYIRGFVLRHLQQDRKQCVLDPIALETLIGVDGRHLTEFIPDPKAPAPDRRVLSDAGFETLLQGLRPQHQAVIRGIFQEEKTAGEIAAELKIDREVVRRMQKTAIAKLRHNLIKRPKKSNNQSVR